MAGSVTLFLSFCLWEGIRRSVLPQEKAITIIGVTHAIIVSILSLLCVLDLPCISSTYLFSFSAGYFLWDTLVVLFLIPFDPSFVVHAVGCFFVFYLGNVPLLREYGTNVLLYELSTPFYYWRKTLIQSGNTQGLLFTFVEATFGGLFFLVRILYGVPLTVEIILYFGRTIPTLETRYKQCVGAYIACFCVVSCFLNLYWFSFMVKRFHSKSQTKTE